MIASGAEVSHIRHLVAFLRGLSGLPFDPHAMESVAGPCEEGEGNTTLDSTKPDSAGSITLHLDKSGLATCNPYVGLVGTSSPVGAGGRLSVGATLFLSAPLNSGVTVHRKDTTTVPTESEMGTSAGQSVTLMEQFMLAGMSDARMHEAKAYASEATGPPKKPAPRQKLMESENAQRRRLGLCLYCRGSGHMAPACPVKQSAQPSVKSNASAKGPNLKKGAEHLALPMDLDYNSSDEDYKSYAKATQEMTKDISEREDIILIPSRR
uniref:Uncharacterized protein n=1 Tax=Sphaerodactylus townsendi TaxID=933632 RepID=A0ACB8ECS0_9SAUR